MYLLLAGQIRSFKKKIGANVICIPFTLYPLPQ